MIWVRYLVVARLLLTVHKQYFNLELQLGKIFNSISLIKFVHCSFLSLHRLHVVAVIIFQASTQNCYKDTQLQMLVSSFQYSAIQRGRGASERN